MSALQDLRVLDLTRLLPGPFCSLLLADMGADVIKIEDTAAGDYVRWSPPYLGDEDSPNGTRSAAFLGLNRNKRSVRVDLKADAGREAFMRLAERADVVLEGFRPGVMDRLGIGYEALHAINRRIIFCSLSGYGQDGPLRGRAGHDMNYLALTGLLDSTGEPGGRPIQAAGQIADIGGGAQSAAIGILAALVERGRTGEGQMVDVSMTDGAMSWQAMTASAVLAGEPAPDRGENPLAGGLLCYLPYQAADGWVACGALEQKFWRAWCEGVERPDLIDLQYQPPGSDGWRAVADVFSSRTRSEWQEFNAEHDCCIEPVLTLEEALGSELFKRRQMVVEVDQPGVGRVRQLATPLGRGSGAARPAPALGQHTDELLREAGYDAAQIANLHAAGVIAGPMNATARDTA